MTKKIVKRTDANNETLYFYTHSDAVDVGEGSSTKSLTEVIDDTLHKSAQTLTNAEKTQVYENLGLNGVDDVPTENSNNIVRSGGVKAAIDDVIDDFTNRGFMYKGIAPASAPIGEDKTFYIAKSGDYTAYTGIGDGSFTLNGIAVLTYDTASASGGWTKNDIVLFDDEPTAGSDKLVKSGGVEKNISLTSRFLTTYGNGNTMSYGSVVRGFKAGSTYKFSIIRYDEVKNKIREGEYGDTLVLIIKANTKEDWTGTSITLSELSLWRLKDSFFLHIPNEVDGLAFEELFLRLGVKIENGYKVLVSIEEQTSFVSNRDYNSFNGNTGRLSITTYRSDFVPIPTFNGSFYKLTNLSNQTAIFSTIDFSGQNGRGSLACAGGGSIVFQQIRDCDFIYANVGNIDFSVEKLNIPASNVIDGGTLLFEQGYYGANNVKSYSTLDVRTKYLVSVSEDNSILKLPDGFVVERYITCNADGSFIGKSNILKTNIVLLNTGYYLFNVIAAESGRSITPDELNYNRGNQIINYLSNKAVDLIESKASGTISTSTTLYPYRTYKGHYYIVTNKGTSTFNFSTKDLNDTFGAGVSSVLAGGSKVLIQTKDCDFLKTNINNASFEIEEIKIGDLPVIDGTTFLFEQGFYNVVGDASTSDIYVRTKALFNVASDCALITVPDGFIIARSFDFNENRKMISTEAGTTNYVSLKKGYHHINIKKEEADAKIVPSEVMCYGDMLQDVGLIHPITAAFDFNTELLNIDSELADMDFNAKDTIDCWTFQEQIYAKWDALTTANPTLIEKIDLADYVSEEYPEYANLNGVASGSYAATPSYRTYMYKLCMPTSSANVRDAIRRKVFIVAGLHGWENASQFNTYVAGSMLCKIASNDYYALGSVYDFYFIPCLNGYGAYHYTRQNANGVDINRNFPHPNWKKQGNPGDYSYTGETPASEFETRLVCKAVGIIKPDLFIDHHTYGPTSYNFYAEASSPLDWPILFQNLYAWNYRACKEYPEYYGTKYPVRPNGFAISTGQTANGWAHNVGVSNSITLEVCTGIGFINGEPNPYTTATLYKAPIIRLNELMLRLMLLRFAEYQLKNGLRTSNLDSSLLVE